MDESIFLHQQRQQQDFQRDLALRQILLQEQMDQQSRFDTILQEQQLRALGLTDLDIQNHYQRYVFLSYMYCI